jgi:SAM-dependent methyltransferase
MTGDAVPELPVGAFAKQDAGDDLAFYAPPRLVTHIDERAVTALTACYRDVIPQGARVLDLMSSWISHLPSDRAYAEVVGQGMNAEELAANVRLDHWFVQDLNRDAALPLANKLFDAALCCVGVQYLQQPVSVFSEVRRALTADAPFVVSFSNRCFPTKAVAIWRSLDTTGRAALVQLYLERAGFGSITVEMLADGRAGDPLIAVIGRA